MKRYLLAVFLLAQLFIGQRCLGMYDLSICALFQNEARFLEEWLLFHLCQGVQHFYLYNNNSTDDYLDVLNPYIELGIVDLIDWSYNAQNHDEWFKIQKGCYDHALKITAPKSRWVAFIDSDEFLFSCEGKSLPSILSDYKGFGGVVVMWQCYGSSGIQRIPPGQFMLELLLHKAPHDHSVNGWFKTIAQPKLCLQTTDAHRMKYKKGHYGVYENHKKAPSSVAVRPKSITTKKLCINHYWSRDREFLETQKYARYQLWHEFHCDVDKRDQLLNSVYDPRLAHAAAAMRVMREKIIKDVAKHNLD